MKRSYLTSIFFMLFMLTIMISFETSSAVIISDLTRLSDAKGCAPSFSPDGRKVAFGDGFDIWMIDVDNTNLTPLTADPTSFDWTASWSPDGKKIAFMSSRAGNFDIWTIDTDRTNLTQLTTDPSDEGYPSWSPDGKKIAFNSGRSGNWDIWILDLENGNLTQLTTHPKNDMQAAWSPDEKKIAFASYRGSKIDTDIYVIDVDGRNLIQLTTDPADDDHPTWSPDGKWIAFRSTRSENPDIWVMRSDGKNQTQLTTEPGVDECCSWGPSGKIAFGSKRPGQSNKNDSAKEKVNTIRLLGLGDIGFGLKIPSGVNVQIAQIDFNKTLPQPPSKGKITITSKPPIVDLYIDGIPEGRTPKTVQVQPGIHKIKLSRTGFNDWVIDVEVEPGSTKNISASLTVASKPPRILSFLAIGVSIGLILVVLYFITQKKG